MSLKRKASSSKSAASKPAVAVAPARTDDFTAFDSASDSDDASAPGLTGLDDAAADDDDGDVAEDSESEAENAAEDDRVIRLADLQPSISSALSERQAGRQRGKAATVERGVLYIGRIPHGFYEQEMQGYFGQFGAVSRLRLSRSKKTGKSKHFAFVEFEDREVAEVVAKSMNNYLLAGRLLQVKLLTPAEVKEKGGAEELFKGAGRKFKAVPWHAVEKARLEAPKTQEQWDVLEKRNKARRSKKADKLKALGIDYEYAPAAAAIEPAPEAEVEVEAVEVETAPTSLSLAGQKRKAPKSGNSKGPAKRVASSASATGKRSSSRKVSVH